MTLRPAGTGVRQLFEPPSPADRRLARPFEHGAVQRHAQQVGVELVAVLQVLLVLPCLTLYSGGWRCRCGRARPARASGGRRRSAAAADVGAVHDVGVGHDDDAVVAQLVDVEVVAADAGAQRGDQREDLVRLLTAASRSAPSRRSGSCRAAAGSPGTCGRGPAWRCRRRSRPRRCRSRTAPGPPWQSASLPGRPMPSSTPLRRVISRALRAASRGARGVDDLAADDLGVDRVLQQVVGERSCHHVFHRAAHLAATSLSLVWLLNFGLGHLHAQHAAQAFAHVVAAISTLAFLASSLSLDVLVDDARHRRGRPVRWVPPSRLGCCW